MQYCTIWFGAIIDLLHDFCADCILAFLSMQTGLTLINVLYNYSIKYVHLLLVRLPIGKHSSVAPSEATRNASELLHNNYCMTGRAMQGRYSHSRLTVLDQLKGGT